MNFEIIKAHDIGFCYGVKRAIEMLEIAAHEHDGLETLGVVVHNEQVMQRLGKLGIKIIDNPFEIRSRTVAISSHGVSPQIEVEVRAHPVNVIDTTCPSVKHAQQIAHSMSEQGLFVVVFGDGQHPEVKGILGWAGAQSMATLDTKPLVEMKNMPSRIGILSQTTQTQENYSHFLKEVLDFALGNVVEIRIVDTICKGVKVRQAESMELARHVELLLVIGSHSSANTRRLFEICSDITETHFITEARDISTEWLIGKQTVGITSGTSTSDQTIEQVEMYLESLKH